MIKRRYVIAFFLVLFMFAGLTFYTYTKNYYEEIARIETNIEKISQSASQLYDSMFYELCSKVKNAKSSLENTSSSNRRMKLILEGLGRESYIISNAYLLFEDGSVIGDGSKITFDKDVMMNHFKEEKDLCSRFEKAIVPNTKLFNKLTRIENINGKDAILITTFDYGIINEVARPDTYAMYDGYLYLVSKSGNILYHKNVDFIGRNIIEDKAYIKVKSNMSEDDYDYLSGIVQKSRLKGNIVKYKAYNTQKLGYYTRLENFKGILFFAFDYGALKNNLFLAMFRSLMPVFITFIIGCYLLYKYIYTLKYTDYFAEVKNHFAFRNHVQKLAKNPDEEFLIIKVENIYDERHQEILYDERVYFNISTSFKKLKDKYVDLYRISRVHYLFVLKKGDDESKNDLVRSIEKPIDTKERGRIEVRSKKLLLNFDSIGESLVDVDIVAFMEDDQNHSDTEKFISYGDIIRRNNEMAMKKERLMDIIDNDRIVAFYQPIYNIDDNVIEKHEVLMRVNENGSYLPPFDIIKMAEREGLIQEIDKKVIKQAFNLHKSYRDRLGRIIQMNINISGKEVEREFLDYIYETAEKYGVKPENVTFELTETSALENLDKGIMYLNELRQKGFKIAIDDFGTGYAHVELLSKIEVDYLKIDGIFIKDAVKDPKMKKILRALVYIGKTYNTKLVGEYVEDESILELLRELEVNYGQGYYFGKPEIEPLLT